MEKSKKKGLLDLLETVNHISGQMLNSVFEMRKQTGLLAGDGQDKGIIDLCGRIKTACETFLQESQGFYLQTAIEIERRIKG